MTLFRQFGTKQDLFTEVVEAGKLQPGTIERLFSEELGQLPPAEALLQIAQVQLDFFRSRMAWITGGPLSHAAIVAREYGIPAVLGTGSATALLRDGQVVTVDGSAGWVM